MLEGQPQGRALAHWDEAERQVEAELIAEMNRPNAGTNEAPAANMVVHHGLSPDATLPGFQSADGIGTPDGPSKPGH